MRGKRDRLCPTCNWRRITPAGAGKTFRSRVKDCDRWDHPRRCGENIGRQGAPHEQLGSPPQVRGKPDTPADETETDRITPAGAGKTTRHKASCNHSPDHPRRCGENLTICPPPKCRLGSPPQVRGKQAHEHSNHLQQRITPAGAGKTEWHIHGDAIAAGSPPQVRGKPRRRTIKCSNIRITPAGAGKTPARWGCCRLCWDHPRRCGENLTGKDPTDE